MNGYRQKSKVQMYSNVQYYHVLLFVLTNVPVSLVDVTSVLPYTHGHREMGTF